MPDFRPLSTASPRPPEPPLTMAQWLEGRGDHCPEDRIPFVGKLLIVALPFAVVPLLIIAFS